jgi:hypothetical protein
MQTTSWARKTLPILAIAIAAFGARPAFAQAPAPVVPAASDSTDKDAYLSGSESMETVHVVATKSRSRFANERSLIAGNRILAKELAKYDRKIVELEQRLDSLRIAAAHKWKDAREMESAAQAARERRIEMERRLAVLEADTTRVNRANAGPR